ncbi:pyruvate formate lyase family protein [Escherichia coli]
MHIVKPPVCTERAQHYTEMYQQHLDKPIPVRRALALAHHLANRTIWIERDELIIGNGQAKFAPRRSSRNMLSRGSKKRLMIGRSSRCWLCGEQGGTRSA